jgi:hypothetical protein
MHELSRYVTTGANAGQPVPTLPHPGAAFPAPIDQVPELLAFKLVVAVVFLLVAYVAFRYGPREDRTARVSRVVIPALLLVLAVHELLLAAEIFGAWLFLAQGVSIL